MVYQNFYIELGNLLYAFAKSDGLISKREWDAVHEAVVKDLVPNEPHTDEYGMDAAYYVEMQFETLQEQDADPQDTFTSFIDYVEEHHTAFDERLRTATVEIAQTVAGSFRTEESKEYKLLVKLRHKIQELEKTS
jgi:hypothetical protein